MHTYIYVYIYIYTQLCLYSHMLLAKFIFIDWNDAGIDLFDIQI